MKSLTQKNRELLETWSSEREKYNFTWDGVLNEKEYLKAKPKICFLLKETLSDFTEIAPLSEKNKEGLSGGMYQYMSQYIYSITSAWNKNILDNQKLNESKEKPVNSIAYIEIKKNCENKYPSVDSDLKQYAQNDAEYLREQIKIAKPKVIFCAKTFVQFQYLWSLNELEQLNDVVYKHKKTGRFIIDYYHPSAVKFGTGNFYQLYKQLLDGFYKLKGIALKFDDDKIECRYKKDIMVSGSIVPENKVIKLKLKEHDKKIAYWKINGKAIENSERNSFKYKIKPQDADENGLVTIGYEAKSILDSLTVIRFDSSKITGSFPNLATMPKGGKITLSANIEDGKVAYWTVNSKKQLLSKNTTFNYTISEKDINEKCIFFDYVEKKKKKRRINLKSIILLFRKIGINIGMILKSIILFPGKIAINVGMILKSIILLLGIGSVVGIILAFRTCSAKQPEIPKAIERPSSETELQPVEVIKPTSTPVLELRHTRIYFVKDTDTFLSDAEFKQTVIAALAEDMRKFLEEDKDSRFIIHGYSASFPGNPYTGEALAEQRAEKVIKLLQAEGIPFSSLIKRYTGGTNKWGDNSTEVQRVKNRVVTIEVEK